MEVLNRVRLEICAVFECKSITFHLFFLSCLIFLPNDQKAYKLDGDLVCIVFVIHFLVPIFESSSVAFPPIH